MITTANVWHEYSVVLQWNAYMFLKHWRRLYKGTFIFKVHMLVVWHLFYLKLHI